MFHTLNATPRLTASFQVSGQQKNDVLC